MTRVVCFVGDSGSGKTTVLERLIPVLKARGRRVAVIKHCHHNLKVDHPGTDSDRMWTAGADVVVASGTEETLVRRRAEADNALDALIRLVDAGMDVVLVEGYKWGRFPKVVVSRTPRVLDVEGVVAVVTDQPLKTDAPRFSPDDISTLADFIEKVPPYADV